MKIHITFKDMRKAIALSASFLLAFSACKKDGELVPDFEENNILSLFSDSTEIVSRTLVGDSVLADKISIGLVGSYKDSAFGKVTSNFYVQPLLSSNGLVFKETDETIVVDSVVLALEYTNFYGDTSVSQTFEVYRLAEKLDFDGNYYSDTSIQTEATPLATKSFTPTPNTETIIQQPNNTGGIDTVALNPQLRIRLDNALAAEILSKSGGSEVMNNDNFTEFFKGLHVRPQPGSMFSNNEAAILYFRLTASNTKLSVYYKVVDPSSDTSNRVIDFPINTSSVRFNTFSHDYTGSAVESILQNPGMTTNFSYTEAMAGVETRITFPSLREKFSNKILVNKAELILPAANGSYDEFGKASNIILASRSEAGALQFIPDAFESTQYFGGTYIESENAYRFNIARYIQSYLNGEQNDKGLTILVTGSAVKAERVIFLNENNSGEKIRLNLYYTNI